MGEEVEVMLVVNGLIDGILDLVGKDLERKQRGCDNGNLRFVII